MERMARAHSRRCAHLPQPLARTRLALCARLLWAVVIHCKLQHVNVGGEVHQLRSAPASKGIACVRACVCVGGRGKQRLQHAHAHAAARAHVHLPPHPHTFRKTRCVHVRGGRVSVCGEGGGGGACCLGQPNESRAPPKHARTHTPAPPWDTRRPARLVNALKPPLHCLWARPPLGGSVAFIKSPNCET